MKILARAAALAPRGSWRSKENLIRLAIFIGALSVVTAIFLLRGHITLVGLGYAGVALTSLIASAGLVVPVPALATVCVTSAFLTPWTVGLLAGVFETLGELTGYLLGYSGQGIVARRRGYQKLESWMRRRGWVLLFLLSLVPNPVFDVVGITAGALRYPLGGFLGVVLAGKVLKFLGISYACVYGIEGLAGLFD